ncbi:MAG: SbcC/MukB-like Walker B domain-containing protein [Pseudomonadota bacterium]
MKLDRLILVNWGQIRPGDYDMGDVTLLTGQTGSGKSTMLDALQTVMTAAIPGIYNYNPGQDEVTQGQRRGKTKRTLESYVVGAEYSRFSRPNGAHAYMAAVFRPSEGEDNAKPFTAVVAAAARVDGVGERRDAKLEKLELIIVDDAILTFDDFVKDAAANEWVAVEGVVRRLKDKYRKVAPFDTHKKNYICALYGRFRGKPSVPWDEAQNAAKAWCQSIAYRPIGSVHDLVRDDILEFDAKQLQESISRIGDLMRQVTNLREEGERIGATVQRLKELKTVIGKTTAAFEEQVQYDLLLAKLHLRVADEAVADETRCIASDTALAKQHDAKSKSDTALRKTIDASRIDVAAKLRGIPAHGEKERLEESLKRATSSTKTVLEGLNRSLLSAAQLDNAARQLMGKPIPEQFPKLKAAVQAVATAVAATAFDRLAALRQEVLAASVGDVFNVALLRQLVGAFEGTNTGVSELHAALVGPSGSASTAIAAESTALSERSMAAQTAVMDLASKKARLAAGGGNYGRDTVVAVDRVRDRYPEASVQVLSDLIEPASEAWQAAIEGYLGNSRFNLIVKPEWEARVIDYLQTWGSGARVIQGKKCLDHADASRVPQDSIIHELHTDNPIARAYLIDQYGPVVKVNTTEQLRHTSRGLTKEGKGSGSRTMFVCEQRNLAFGRKARERALQEVTEQLLAAEAEVDGLEVLRSTLTVVQRLLMNLKEPSFDAAPLHDYASDIEHARRALVQLDLKEVDELQSRLKQLEAELLEYDKSIEVSKAAVVLAEKRISEAEETIRRSNLRQDARLQEHQHQTSRLKHLCEANPERTYSVMAQQVADLVDARVLDVTGVQSKLSSLRVLPVSMLGEVRELLSEYNQRAKSEERFSAALPHHLDDSTFDLNYGPVANLGRAVGQMHNNMESVGVYNNRDALTKAERSFHDVFTKQFCVEIKTKVDDGIRTLKQLNAELHHLKFGSDRFSIDWSRWEPEFEEYHAFFRAVTELADANEAIDLFGETELSPKHIAVRNRLVGLLLDKNQEVASRELLRIADYRNYRRYEIWNESDSGGRIALSTWGTGSGGQLETPAYIVRAAIVTNRLKFFEKGPSLKLLVNDESFSKMDEQRARDVLRFLRDSLKLQVISAMPTKAAGGLRDEFNREYSFTRAAVDENGELDFISDCDERVLKTDRMRELWAQQRVLVREQAKLAFEEAETGLEAGLVMPLEIDP